MLLLFKVIGAWQPRETGMAAKKICICLDPIYNMYY